MQSTTMSELKYGRESFKVGYLPTMLCEDLQGQETGAVRKRTEHRDDALSTPRYAEGLNARCGKGSLSSMIIERHME